MSLLFFVNLDICVKIIIDIMIVGDVMNNIKRVYYVTALIVIMMISFLGITYSFEYGNNDDLKFELIGPSTVSIDVFDDYVEYGIKIIHDGVDVSNRVSITNNVDITRLGEYSVKYQYGNEYIYRNVKVVDKISPVISLVGGSEVYILLGGKYEEAGYIVDDNYDKDLEKKVKITGTVDTSREGEYELEYSVSDSSGNIDQTSRTVIVKKSVINSTHESGGRVGASLYNVYLYSNTIIENSFNENGVYYRGYVRNGSNSYKIKLKGKDNNMEYIYNMTVDKNNFYSGNLNLSKLKNGSYDLYIVGTSEERLINKLDVLSKIVRSKVGNKLVTFSYNDDLVTINVQSFEYNYDFVIDPGHGGSDIGASNGLVAEKNVNLMVSKYEKCRYESMGYRVYMIRYDDTYGELLGGNDLDQLDRRSLTTGYYGAVSRITYSNHHNGSRNTNESGFEILVQGARSKSDLVTEYLIYDRFKKFYKIDDDKIRIYSKDYDSEKILDKTYGQVYGNKNYYSALRIPYELFNVTNVIYEPIYMTNSNDFNWYYASNNWIKVSELKIQEYVNYLGGTYKSDNSMCI